MALLRGARLRPLAAARAGLLVVAARRLARRPTPLFDPRRSGDGGRAARLPAAVTVVIPARDEAGRIGACLAALRETGPGDLPPVHVVVVDDGSTDATASVARSGGATVIDAGPLPPGWAGKARALQVGLDHATTDVVVTIDADVRVSADTVRDLAARLGSATMCTVAARIHVARAGEQWLHPSMLATLVYRFGRPGVVPADPNRTMASGQCMVVHRTRLEAAGGLTPVRGNLLEDLALARHLARAGHDVRFVDGDGAVEVEGYGSARATWRGWGRSLDLAEVTPTSHQALDLAVLWATMGLPGVRIAAGRGDLVDAAALALRAGVSIGTRSAYRPVGVWHLLSPIADPAVIARITWGTFRPDRRWRGRTYGRETGSHTTAGSAGG